MELPRRLTVSLSLATAEAPTVLSPKWRIGNNSFEPQNLDEQYNSLLYHFNINQDTMSGIYPGINSIGAFQRTAFREHSYASICSLNFPEKGNVYTVSGLDTEQTQHRVDCKYRVDCNIYRIYISWRFS